VKSTPAGARGGGAPRGAARAGPARSSAPGLRRGLPVLVIAAAALLVALSAYSAFRAGAYTIGGLARSAPRRTALMLQRETEARSAHRILRIDQRWVSYERMSPLLRRAILVAEDDAFFQHGGLDWNEIRASARANLEKRRVVRGGSTITQQLAKNLFLGDRRTLTRKLTEAFLAIRLERALSKRRIFELYLNLIEWGDGIFGAEAAARRYFGVSAADLNEREAILLAAVIINPRRYSVLAPNRRIERRVRLISGRLRRRGFLSDAGYESVVGLPAADRSRATAGATEAGAPLPDSAPPVVAPSDSTVADTSLWSWLEA
jgi:monofunctional biosynthetic peptidoglycan transglycosylase